MKGGTVVAREKNSRIEMFEDRVLGFSKGKLQKGSLELAVWQDQTTVKWESISLSFYRIELLFRFLAVNFDMSIDRCLHTLNLFLGHMGLT